MRTSMKMPSTFFSSDRSICSPSRSLSMDTSMASLACFFTSAYTSSAQHAEYALYVNCSSPPTLGLVHA